MKRLCLLILLTLPFVGISQDIFDYENKISNRRDYKFQEIEFQNTDENIKLSGNLITPKSDFDKIVIIVPGSDPSTRYAHFILAEEFLKNGIAVYRFDKRGLGKSEGKDNDSPLKLSNDLSYAYKMVSAKFNDKSVGILGHSLGGMATLEMIENGLNPQFLILVGTPAVKNGAYLINRLKTDYESSIAITTKGKTEDQVIGLIRKIFKLIVDNPDTDIARSKAKKIIKEDGFNRKFIHIFDDEEMVERVKTNHEQTLQNLSIPTLYIVGTKDDVLDYKKESDLVTSLNNDNIKVEVYEGLNHWLTEKDAEEGTSLYKMDEEPLNEIMRWTNEI